MNVDDFMFRRRRGDAYHCGHFLAEVWQAATGEDLAGRLGAVLGPLSSRKLTAGLFRAFLRLPEPVSPCIVLMSQNGRDPHVGLFYDGAVLHLGANGVEYFPLEIAGRSFNCFRFYK